MYLVAFSDITGKLSKHDFVILAANSVSLFLNSIYSPSIAVASLPAPSKFVSDLPLLKKTENNSRVHYKRETTHRQRATAKVGFLPFA